MKEFLDNGYWKGTILAIIPLVISLIGMGINDKSICGRIVSFQLLILAVFIEHVIAKKLYSK